MPTSKKNEIRPLLSQLEKSILTSSNISKDLESEITHMQMLLSQVGRHSEGGSKNREQFAETLVRSREIIQSVMQSTKHFASITKDASTEFQGVAGTFKEMANTFKELKGTGQQLSKFVNVIQDIADQTKLLSLNARIEAERAGEHGRGFSVVADEVRSLAAESKDSSDSIFDSIESFTQILTRFEEELTTQLLVFDESQQKLNGAGNMALDVQMKIGDMVNAIEQMENILTSLEHLGDIEHSMNQALISSENLNRYVHRSLEVSDKLMVSNSVGSNAPAPRHIMQELHDAIVQEEHQKSLSIIQNALQKDQSPQQLLEILANVCEQIMYEQKQRKITLSELYVNGTIIEDILSELLPDMGDSFAGRESKGTIVLGNAYGDYHSLGRKMVGVLLKASGFHVIDLGLSVPNEKLMQTAIENNAKLIGVSALLLHTAVKVTELRKMLDKQGRSDIKIMVGGAPFLIDENLNESIGADFVATSAAEGVDLANYIFGEDIHE